MTLKPVLHISMNSVQWQGNSFIMANAAHDIVCLKLFLFRLIQWCTYYDEGFVIYLTLQWFPWRRVSIHGLLIINR